MLTKRFKYFWSSRDPYTLFSYILFSNECTTFPKSSHLKFFYRLKTSKSTVFEVRILKQKRKSETKKVYDFLTHLIGLINSYIFGDVRTLFHWNCKRTWTKWFSFPWLFLNAFTLFCKPILEVSVEASLNMPTEVSFKIKVCQKFTFFEANNLK